MKLNEFVGIDHPSEKIVVGDDVIKEMINRESEVDLSAFLCVYQQLCCVDLPNVAAERAVSGEWDKHPMLGINADVHRDKWAKVFFRKRQLADAVFEILKKRIDQTCQQQA